MQTLESIRNLLRLKDSLRLHFGHRWLAHFGCANGYLRLCHAFFGWGFISGHGTYRWSSSFGKRPSCIGHFVFMRHMLTFFLHSNNSSLFFLASFGEFQQKNFISMWKHYEFWVMGIYSRPLDGTSSPTPIFFGGISLLSMEDYALSTFLGSWALVVLYLCSMFRIFDRPILKEYIFQVEGGPHLFQSCLDAT